MTSQVTFDEAMESMGAFGRHQGKVLGLMCLLSMSMGVHTLITVFTMATPKFRCAIPELQHDFYSEASITHQELLNVSIPWEENDDGELVRSQCKLYLNRNISEGSAEGLLSNRSTASCHEWVYDHTTFSSTFTEQENLVCDRKGYHANTDMLYMVGVLAGSFIIGFISDRFGRKTALLLAMLLHVGCSIGTAFVSSYVVFTVLRFFQGFGNLGCFLIGYVLGLEMIGDSLRTVAGTLYQTSWSVGLFIFTGVAYGVRDWRRLQLAMGCPTALFLAYSVIISESPRWLSSKGRFDEANAILARAAKENKRPPPPLIGKTHDDQEVKKESPLRMFTNRVTLTRTLIVFFNWAVVTMIYYGLSLNVGTLGGNIYLNFFLSALAEMVGMLLSLVGLDRVGRKGTHCVSLILGGLACLATMFPVMYAGGQTKYVTVLVLSNLGKMGASSAFNIIYLYSAELFPTVVRTSLMGVSSTVGRIGGIVSPYVAQLNVLVGGGNLGVALPLVVFGGSALAAGLLALLLPETLNTPLPETIEDAISLGKKETEGQPKVTSYTNTAYSP